MVDRAFCLSHSCGLISGCLLGGSPSKGGQQLKDIMKGGFKAEKSSLMALVDQFRKHMKLPAKLPSSHAHLEKASQAIGNIKTRLEAKKFRLAIAGEATGVSTPLGLLHLQTEKYIGNSLSLGCNSMRVRAGIADMQN